MTENTTFPFAFPATFGFRSSSNQPQDAIKEILKNTPEESTDESNSWQVEKPEIIEHAAERTPKARHNESHDAIYIFSDVSADLERLSADGVQLDSYPTVEIQIWTLEEGDLAPRGSELQTEIVRLLGNLMDDNKARTGFNDIQPTGTSDHRNESSPRRSEHTVMGVTVEMHRRNPLGET